MIWGSILDPFGFHFGDLGEDLGPKTTENAPGAKGSISVDPFLAKNDEKWSQQGGPKSLKIDKKTMPKCIQMLHRFWKRILMVC